ncbi:hypothetical protein HPB49_016574 [Dermacentor silvarum]|uniref:Uncharacterized protein n=1 Tax=Dermacentor silvarum TaxID=543639 RepID=A0ACB8DEQ5_DERSI|nr:hypothetical protein HPB49_016574 [Dermacentor silvarum]
MTRCAQLLRDKCSVDFVDINMGCPIDFVYKKRGPCWWCCLLAIEGSTFDESVSADDDVAIMGQLQDEDYVADVVPTTSQSDSNKEIDDGPLPTSSEVISALALVWCYCVNIEGCSLSCSDSLDTVEACVLSQAAKSLKRKKIQDYFVPK